MFGFHFIENKNVTKCDITSTGFTLASVANEALLPVKIKLASLLVLFK